MSLIEIFKQNTNPNLKLLLFSAEVTSLFDLRDYARRAEKVLQETKPLRQVNEVAIVPLGKEEEDEYEIDPQLDTLNISKRFSKPDYSKIKCWNCLAFGHSYIYCPDDSRHLFCYKGGNRGVSTVNCTNQHVGNRKRSVQVSGDTRSKPYTP